MDRPDVLVPVTDDPLGQLDEVLEAAWPRLVAQLRSLTGDRATAEAAVAAAFVRAYARPARVLESRDPEAWLRAVARRRARWSRRPGRTPSPADLRRRGRDRRRRRHLATVVVTASAVLATVAVADTLAQAPTGPEPPPTVRLDRWPGNPHWPALERGTYRFPLSPFDGVPTVRFTLPPGWQADVELRHDAGPGQVRLVVADVDQVVRKRCQATDRGMVDVADRRSDIAAALSDTPGLEVLRPARKVTAFGRPAVLVHLRTTDAVRCPYGAKYNVVDTANGLVTAGPPGSTWDVWAVDVAGQAVLVAAIASPDADADGRAALRSALDGVELLEPVDGPR